MSTSEFRGVIRRRTSALAVVSALGGLLVVRDSAEVAQAAAPTSDATLAASVSRPTLIASPEPDWPQWRGPRRDGICDERGLLQEWPEGGPKLLWKTNGLGRGYSAPIIVGGRLFITGDAEGQLHLFAYNLNGQRQWHSTNGRAWANPYPGARGSCAYSGGRIYHKNAHGRVACFDAETGRELWHVDTLAAFAGENITWGLAECLLVDGERVICTVGGAKALLAALDRKSGRTVWQSQSLREFIGPEVKENENSASYVAPILVKLGERRLIVGAALRHVFCADADTGRLLWAQPMRTTHSVIAMTPVLTADGIFLTAPHTRDGGLFRFGSGQEGDALLTAAWTTRLDTCHGGVVLVGSRLVGSWYARKGWACLEARSGDVLYELPEYVKGSVLLADQRLYVLCEDGQMLLLALGQDSFAVKGRFRLTDAREKDAWAHPVVHQGHLYLRSHDTLFCYDVSQRASQ